jgi:hypothetical protein
MFQPVEVKPLPNYRLWLCYDDGTAGEVDLAHLAGKGVFKLWNDYQAFEQVYIGPQGQIAWSEQIDLCPDALYLALTGKKPEDVFSNLKRVRVDA